MVIKFYLKTLKKLFVRVVQGAKSWFALQTHKGMEEFFS
jgi:hypothetical protein